MHGIQGAHLRPPTSPAAGAGAAQPSDQPSQEAAAKGQAQAAAAAAAVQAAHEAAAAKVEAVLAAAQQRTDAHREACDAEEAELRRQVADEAEGARRENRAIDLEWEQLQVGAGC